MVSDEFLIERVVRRDEAAFAALYERYYTRLQRFVVRTTGYLGSAEETINDVMYVVWEKAGSFRADSKASTWIFGIAHNKALKSLKRELGGNATPKTSLTDIEVSDPANQAQQMETEGWLSAALTELSPQHRATVELSYYHGMSCNEIAQIMDCNESTVKTRMFYARKRLRTRLPELAEGNRPARDTSGDL